MGGVTRRHHLGARFPDHLPQVQLINIKERTVTETATAPTTTTLAVRGARLAYDVRRNDQSSEPILFLIGSPMAAAGFPTLASHFTDRTVVTYDPRGSERSELIAPTIPPTPEEHAADLHRIISELGGGPVDLFATSGGAVNAMALVAEYPDDVRTLIAHEPPLPSLLPDREAALAAARAVHETYAQRGWGAGMAHFITVISHRGEFPADFAQQPGPDPAMFGMPTGDDGSRTDPLLALALVGSIGYEPDFEALRAASTRIVMAAGAESEGEMASRGAYAVAERLSSAPMIFPSNHGGFLGGEYGQTGDPDAFAAKLRDVLKEG
jgi:pimeloyl-ACP methyl ester carboxylesterase